jgi:hypothetical protein
MATDFCTSCNAYTYWSFNSESYAYECNSCDHKSLTYWNS